MTPYGKKVVASSARPSVARQETAQKKERTEVIEAEEVILMKTGDRCGPRTNSGIVNVIDMMIASIEIGDATGQTPTTRARTTVIVIGMLTNKEIEKIRCKTKLTLIEGETDPTKGVNTLTTAKEGLGTGNHQDQELHREEMIEADPETPKLTMITTTTATEATKKERDQTNTALSPRAVETTAAVAADLLAPDQDPNTDLDPDAPATETIADPDQTATEEKKITISKKMPQTTKTKSLRRMALWNLTRMFNLKTMASWSNRNLL